MAAAGHFAPLLPIGTAQFKHSGSHLFLIKKVGFRLPRAVP